MDTTSTTETKSNADESLHAPTTSSRERVDSSHDRDDFGGCPQLDFDDSDLQLRHDEEEFDSETDDEPFSPSEIIEPEPNVEFEYDFDTPSVDRELSVLKQFQDIVEHEIVEVFGEDKYGRKVITISACRLPEAGHNGFDPARFLEYLLNLLDLYVEADYTLIYFHYGYSKNRLPYKWLYHAYQRFDRKYKKNLKALYIVHPTNVVKILYKVFKTVISYKFGKKMMYCRSLTELAQQMDVPDLKQVNIPEPVLEYDAKIVSVYQASHPQLYGARDNIMQPLPTQQFGVSVQFLRENNPNQLLPIVVNDAVEYIRANAMETPHIFRRSAPVHVVKEVQAKYNQGRTIVYDNYCDPHLAAVILKSFLRELPEPLLTLSSFPKIIDAAASDLQTQIRVLKSIVRDDIPKDNYVILKCIIELLYDISNVPKSLMNKQALAIIFGPNLVWDVDKATNLHSLQAINTMSQVLIENFEEIFEVKKSSPSKGAMRQHSAPAGSAS